MSLDAVEISNVVDGFVIVNANVPEKVDSYSLLFAFENYLKS